MTEHSPTAPATANANAAAPATTRGAAPASATTTTTTTDQRAIRRGFVAAGIVVVCWSGFNIVSRLGGRSPLTPFDLAALRFMVSGLLLLPLFLGGFRPVPASGRAKTELWRTGGALSWRQRLLLALAGGLGYALLAYTGFSLAPAAHAGVLVNGGIPLATTLIGWQVFGLRPTRRALLALLIAGGGFALIARHGLHMQDPWHTLQGDASFLLAAICWGFYGQLVRRWQVDPRLAASNIAVCSAAVYLPVYLLFLPSGFAFASPPQILLQAGYQGIVAGIVAASCYSYATLRIGPTRASLMLALVPPISALLAVPLLGELLTPETAVGALLVTAGAVLGATGGSGVRPAAGPLADPSSLPSPPSTASRR